MRERVEQRRETGRMKDVQTVIQGRCQHKKDNQTQRIGVNQSTKCNVLTDSRERSVGVGGSGGLQQHCRCVQTAVIDIDSHTSRLWEKGSRNGRRKKERKKQQGSFAFIYPQLSYCRNAHKTG